MDVIIEYEIKSQTDTTVSFVVNLFQGSFNAYNKLYFYNLNLAEDRDITLEDLLGENWVEICNTAIQKQIDASVDEDGFTYFFPPDQGGFTTVDEDTDFYIGEDGVPVVVFPQYEIAAGAAGAAEAAPAAEEKTEFDVVLKEIGPNKIAIIKVVREATGLGLADAKKAVEAMGVIKENVPKADADALVAKLKENGATAELK